MAVVWLNGGFVDAGEARVSVFDAAVQHGVGLFETLLAIHSEPIMLEAHLARLARSAVELGLTRQLRTAPLAEAVCAVCRRAGLARARVRVTITGGDLQLRDAAAGREHNPTIVITAQEAAAHPAALFERGALVTIADLRLNPLDPFAGHKTLFYWPRLRALQSAAAKGADETLLLQVTNHLACGAVSNLFVVKDGSLRTPIAQGEEAEEGAELPSPVLPGVTRAWAIEAAQGLGASTAKRMLSVDDLLEADEAFLTNSMWGVLPVTRVEAEAVGDGVVGELTARLVERWRSDTGDEPATEAVRDD